MDPLELARALAGELDSFDRGQAVALAIDGPDGSGKSTLAHHVAQTCRSWGRPVLRIDVDDFLQPRRIRYRRGNDSPEGFVEDTFDYMAMRRLVLEPLENGHRRIVRRIYDTETDTPVDSPAEQVPDGAIVVVDGCLLLRTALRSYWTLGVLLEVAEDQEVRGAAEPGPGAAAGADGLRAKHRTRRSRGFALYLERDDPAAVADIIIDNTNVRRPVPIRWP
jgi:uridine kinase